MESGCKEKVKKVQKVRPMFVITLRQPFSLAISVPKYQHILMRYILFYSSTSSLPCCLSQYEKYVLEEPFESYTKLNVCMWHLIIQRMLLF